MIVPMKRLTLIALKADEEKLMQKLQSISAVEVISSGAPSESDRLSALESNAERLKNAFVSLKPYDEKKKGMGPKPEAGAGELLGELDGALSRCADLEEIERSLASVRSEIEKKDQILKTLLPWQELETKIEDIRPTRSVVFAAGFFEAARLNNLEAPEGVGLELYGAARGLTAAIAAYRKDGQESARGFLKDLGWTDYSFQGMTGTPKENISRIEKELFELRDSEEKLVSRISGFASERGAFARAADAAAIERDREKAKAELLKLNYVFVLEGWIRSDREKEVSDAVKSVTDVCYIEIRDPNEDEVPPSVVENSKLIKPFEAVTNLYSRPAPGGIDGTPLMAFFYFLFFGAMLSDTGYGLVLFIGGLLFTKLMKPTGMTEGIVKVLTMGGVSTVIWGVFIGTFFGLDWNVFLGTPAGTFPLLFDPMAEPMNMLFLCFGLGIVHLLFGVCIKIYMCVKARDWAGAVFDNLSWILVVIGLVVFGLVPAAKNIGLGMAITGGALVFLFAGRERPTIIKRAIKGAGSLYTVTGYFSDMLSYARVFALGISTGVIGAVLNTLGGMLYSSFGKGFIMQALAFLITAALMVALHLFNLGLNVLGTFIHTARLQYVEFYGKFYEAGGREFTPLGYRTKHVKVVRG